jgi:L-lactate permease
MNRQSTWTWVMVVTTIVNPLFNLGLIPATQHRYGNGAIGAGISLLLTEIIVVTAGVVMVGRAVFDRGTVRRTVLGLATAVTMWGVAYEVDRLLGPIPSIVSGAIVFVCLALALRLFTPEEVELLKQTASRVARRMRLRRQPPTSAVA